MVELLSPICTYVEPGGLSELIPRVPAFNWRRTNQQAVEEKGTWPITSDDDASLSMTPEQAAGFMKAETAKEEVEEEAEDGGDDDDLDDMA